MTTDPLAGLREFRDALRNPIPDVDSFVFLLSSTLQALHVHPTSLASDNPQQIIRAINRLLPTVQSLLFTSVIPTFLHALDTSQRGLLTTYFVPKRKAERSTLLICRTIALISYRTVSGLLSASKATNAIPLPPQSRECILSILESLAEQYSIDELYWAVWSPSIRAEDDGQRQGDGMRTLQWEEAVKAAVGLPAKVANSVGRWKEEGWSGDVPMGLVPRPYFDRIIVQLEGLTYEFSQASPTTDLTDVRLIFQRLAALGLLTARPTFDPSPIPSLFTPLLPPLLAHLHPARGSPFPALPPAFLPPLFLPLPTSILATLVDSLLDHLSFRLVTPIAGELHADKPDERIKRASEVLTSIIGPASLDGEAFEAVVRGVTGRKSDGKAMDSQEHSRARVVVAWVGLAEERVTKAFVDLVMEAWTDTKTIKFSLYAQQFGLTHIFLLALSLFHPYHPFLISLSHRPRLMTAMQSYLAHPDPKIRRLGMLVAEIVSGLTIEEHGEDLQYSREEELDELKAGLEVEEETGETKDTKKPKRTGMKRLRFGKEMWDGSGDGRDECRWLRKVVEVRDWEAKLSEDPIGTAWLLGWEFRPSSAAETPSTATTSPVSRAPPRGRIKEVTPAPPRPAPKIVMLDLDQAVDPLEGYSTPSPSSSRSPSPTPSYLEEVAADPSLALDSTQKKEVTRPVYIQQLVALLKEREKPDHLEMGLKWGESLVRAKRSFGRELEESAVAVATMAISLNDAFHLDGFDDKRQGLVVALVACSPKNVAPFFVEQYFNNHFSLQRKFVILTAIAMGARELAGLSVPTPPKARRIDFPSKTLPPTLHRKYISQADTPPAITGQIDEAISGVRSLLLSKGARKGEETIPELAREKRLRVGPSKRTMVAEIGSVADRQMGQTVPLARVPVIPFREVAAEYFIMPLINRFWQNFQDASVREDRAIVSGSRYRGAGTGMLLSPMALEKFFMTLALLLHAARSSPLFLAVLSPEVLELALTVGSRHPSRPDDSPDGGEDTGLQDGSRQEASVVGAALETCLVCLDTSFDLDAGRTLALDRTQLVSAVGEWAGRVFENEDMGGPVAGGQGGMREGRIKAAAAGVVVKIGEIGEKWGRLGMLR